MTSCVPWPVEREEQLRKWWTRYSGGRIAQKFADEGFNVTRNAVCGKANRLGLMGPRTKVPIDNLWAGRSTGPRQAKKSKPAAQVGADIALEEKPATLAFWEPRVYGFNPIGCRWIEGDVQQPGWFYCNAPAKGSYCAQHTILCYRAEVDRAAASNNHRPIPHPAPTLAPE